MSTVSIHITDREGVEHNIDAPTDMAMNLMEVIRSFELAEEGTLGICGGMAMCASCNCQILSSHELPEKSYEEDDMLEQAFIEGDDFRLSCQLPITPDLEGLRIRIGDEV